MHTARKLVLASTSPFRAALLARLGLSFEIAAPRFDEADRPGIPPEELAREFALAKAKSIAGDYSDALIVGSDQVLATGNGAILRKPGSRDDALEQLRSLVGATHTLATGVAIVDARTAASEARVTTVTLTMRALDDDALSRYLDHEDTRGSVGGYHFEGRGVALFERVVGSDDSAIVGLPLVELVTLLVRFGLDPLR